MTTTLSFCADCMEVTTRTAADNTYDDQVLCASCYEELEWLEEHTPEECEDPGCLRDHADEARQDWEDHQYHLMKEEALA